MNKQIIKQRLSEEIKTSGLTVIEIAKRIDVSPEMVTQYKTTNKLPKLETFAKLCEELDLDANYILGLKNNWRFLKKRETIPLFVKNNLNMYFVIFKRKFWLNKQNAT